MSTLSQVGRGAILLTSIALVACYIDVYATGKFPWQHAAETPATIPPPELVNDPTQFVAEPANPAAPIFLTDSKSDVAGSATVFQPNTNGQTTTPAATNPSPTLFLSGTKSFTGQTTLTPGTLTVTPPTPQADAKAPAFLGGTKTIALPPRLPESLTTTPTPNTVPQPQQFMSGFKSPGPAVMPGSAIPAPTPQVQQPTQAPAPGKPAANLPQQQSKPSAAANEPPLFMSGSKSPFRSADIPNQTATPQPQQQSVPQKIAPFNAPQSPAGSY